MEEVSVIVVDPSEGTYAHRYLVRSDYNAE